jgi:hypothetical protein
MGEVLPEEAINVIHAAIAQAVHGPQQGSIYPLLLPDGQHWFELSAAAKGDPHRPGPDAEFPEQAGRNRAVLHGNAGMLFWALPLGAAARWRDALRPALAVPLAAALLVLAQVAFSSIWVFPQWTLDQSTVHRALLTPSALLAAWLAALLTEPVPGGR